MKLRILAVAGLICLALPSASVQAIAADKPASDTSAAGLVDTFAQSCLAYAGRNARLKVWLDANLTIAGEKQSAYFLGGMPGKVWLRTNASGKYAVIVYDLGICTVKAEKAPINDALKQLDAEAAGKLNIKIIRTKDSPNGVFEDIPGRIAVYSLKIDGIAYNIIASGMQEGGGPLQSQFSLMMEGEAEDGQQ